MSYGAPQTEAGPGVPSGRTGLVGQEAEVVVGQCPGQGRVLQTQPACVHLLVEKTPSLRALLGTRLKNALAFSAGAGKCLSLVKEL